MTDDTNGECRPDPATLRANAYSILARLFVRPADWDDRLADDLRQSIARLSPALDAHATGTASALSATWANREKASVAFAKLFLGPYELDASPYASLYLDPERQIMGQVSRFVAEAYADAGLARAEGVHEAPDHITHELEFMYWLAFQDVTRGEAVWEERQREFWTTHLGTWLPLFAGAIIRANRHPVYTALGELLLAFAKHETANFSSN